MSSLSQAFIREKFGDYYRQNSVSILPPSSLERREFGFFILEKKLMLRHQGFKDAERTNNEKKPEGQN